MADRWEDLDVEIRNKIDGMSREAMETHLREEDHNSELRQGLAGEYFEERWKGASGMTVDDFNKQMSLDREKEDEERAEHHEGDDEGEVDDEEDQDDEDEDEPVKEAPGKPHFEDEKKK
jgi:hypothetical protein